MKTQLAKNYQLNNCGKYYTISNRGRDVFYFNKESFFGGFPQQLNVKTEAFNDQLLEYCESKMNSWYRTDEQLEFYIVKYFNRLITYKEKFKLFKIDDYLLDKNGRLSYNTFNYERRLRKKIFQNASIYFQNDVAYSDNINWYIFNFIKKEAIDFKKDKDFAECSRAEFENALSNDELRHEYVEHYNSDNKFYFEFVGDEDENFNFAKIIFFLTQNGKMKLFFLKDNYN
jgi:hypothetical protein